MRAARIIKKKMSAVAWSEVIKRSLCRRPVLFMAIALIIFIMIRYHAGNLDPDGTVYSCGDDRHLYVSGTVVGKECTANGYRITLDHLNFLSNMQDRRMEETSITGTAADEGTSSVYQEVATRLNNAVKPDDRIQIFLSNGQNSSITMYGEGEEASFWTNSAASKDQSDVFQSVMIGDRAVFFGTCRQPECAVNPGQFDSRRYYLARHVIFKMSEADLRNLYRPRSFGLSYLILGYRNMLADVRMAMQKGLQSVFGQEDAAQIAAFTIGDKSGLDCDKKMIFRDGGLSWLICVSSLHISLLGMMIYRFLRKRGKSFALAGAVSFSAVYSFALLSGFSVSSQRALVMFLFWIGAQIFGRTRDTLTSLSGAALVILMRQPYALWDSSFLLSYACILSMEYLTPAIERMVRPRYAFHRKVCGSISIRLGALPAVLWFFYQTTPYAFAVCLITLPVMSILLGFAILGSLASCALTMTGFRIFLYAGRCFAYPCHLLLCFLNLMCQAERALPGSVLILGRPALWQLVVYYVGLVIFAVRIKTLRAASFQSQDTGTKFLKADSDRGSGQSAAISEARSLYHKNGRMMMAVKKLHILRWLNELNILDKRKSLDKRKGLDWLKGLNGLKKTRVMSVIWLCFLLMILCFRSNPAFQFLCLDIGQGSCNLIRHGSHAYLFDAGSSSVKDVWEYRIDSTLKYYGISKLDMVFLSHGDLDHIDGIEQMLEHYNRNLAGRNAGDVTIEKILLPDLPTLDDRLAPIIDGAEEHGIRLLYVNEGDSYSEGDMRMDILGPSDKRITGNSNEDCIVMLITYKTLQIWCMADLEKDGEEMFIKECDAGEKNGKRILIAGHHGSKNATSEALLEKLKPDLVFISCGKNNRYGHPAREMLERLEKAEIRYLRTDQEGAIGIVY